MWFNLHVLQHSKHQSGNPLRQRITSVVSLVRVGGYNGHDTTREPDDIHRLHSER